MKRVHVIGGKNHGKTTLVIDLIHELDDRGLRAGAIKHSHHHHELDIPRKDSYGHRESGAVVVGVLSPAMNALFWTGDAGASSESTNSAARYDTFASAMLGCDVVLVEGDSRTAAPKIEVCRAQFDTQSMADRLADVRAIVTDDEIRSELPILHRNDVPSIVDFLLRMLNDESSSSVGESCGEQRLLVNDFAKPQCGLEAFPEFSLRLQP
ncbi:MAG: molybdopterin-guanine dinucleotide biosynthesis protein B, partial [Planctomycetaceae bacterium]|nr:molybdopterin-guanine dinucleotide biosynthesis protein B [Planctomycetaceae bacterium]